MAVDQTTIALDIAERMTQKVTQLLAVLSELEEEVRHSGEINLNFNNFDADFAVTEGLKHIDGSLLNKLENDVMPGIRNYLDVTLSGAKAFEKVLYEISR